MNKAKRLSLSLTLALTLLLLSTIFVEKNVLSTQHSFSTTTMAVDPSVITVPVSQTFSININISDVIDLYGWEFKLGWDSTLLDVVNIIEGNFLKNGGDTFFTYKINNTAGYILVDCTLLGPVSGVDGDGILAVVEFYVETGGECALDLYDTKLVSSEEQAITHQSNDGYAYLTTAHDIAVTNVTLSKTVIGQGFTLYINVTVMNQGSYTETFDVTAYYDGTPIETKTINSLSPGQETTLSYTLNTTEIPKDIYLTSAHAHPLPEETDTADNTYTDGTVLVTIPGDVNGDGTVNMKDIYACLILHFGCEQGQPCYVPNYDIDGDGKINMKDIFTSILHYGESW